MITSIVAGRARLRNSFLRDPQVLDDCLKSLEAMSEVSSVAANPTVGSLLVRFDPQAISVEAMRARLEALNPPGADTRPRQRVVAGTDPDVPAEPPAQGRLQGVNLGQGVKLGMLASLGSSMFWAYAGKKGPHKQTGGLFLVTLAMHLWMYRNRLLK